MEGDKILKILPRENLNFDVNIALASCSNSKMMVSHGLIRK